MKFSGVFAFFAVVALFLITAGCAREPVREIARAKAAVAAARAAEAGKYVSRELESVQDSLETALAEVAKQKVTNPFSRSYKKAEARLASVVETAQAISKKADVEKAKVEKEVNFGLAKLDSAVTAAKELIQLAPKRGRELKALLEAKAKAIEADAAKALDIRKLKENGDLMGARKEAESAVAAVEKIRDEITSAVENSVTKPKKK